MTTLLTLEEALQEATAPKAKFTVLAVNRVSKDKVNPVAGDKDVELTAGQLAKLESLAKVETIQGEEYHVLDRDDKAAVKAKTPNINKVGATSGYNTLLFKKA